MAATTASRTRAQALNPGWEPASALHEAEFADLRATALVGRRCRLGQGWASGDGRLSARDGTRLKVIGEIDAAHLGSLERTPLQCLRQIVEHRSRWLYRADPQGWGAVRVESLRVPVFERLRQRWEGSATGFEGEELLLRLDDLPGSRLAVRRLREAAGDGLWLFGQWSVEGEQLQLAPVACFDGQVLTQLFCEMP